MACNYFTTDLIVFTSLFKSSLNVKAISSPIGFIGFKLVANLQRDHLTNRYVERNLNDLTDSFLILPFTKESTFPNECDASVVYDLS